MKLIYPISRQTGHTLCSLISQDKQINERKVVYISHLSFLTFVLGDQKNRLSKTVLLSSNNICFG